MGDLMFLFLFCLQLHQQLESVEFDSSASILSSEEIQEIVQRTSPASV